MVPGSDDAGQDGPLHARVNGPERAESQSPHTRFPEVLPRGKRQELISTAVSKRKTQTWDPKSKPPNPTHQIAARTPKFKAELPG